jgi:hypothetical protein
LTAPALHGGRTGKHTYRFARAHTDTGRPRTAVLRRYASIPLTTIACGVAGSAIGSAPLAL